MNETIRIFVNDGVVDLPAGSNVAAAVRAFDDKLEQQISSGAAYVTDGRGIELEPGAVLPGGAILRVVVRSRRGMSVDADA
jgi:hypothetical protein